MDEEIKTRVIRAGPRTYALSAKRAKNGERYLVITQAQLPNKPQTIVVFAQSLPEFKKALGEVMPGVETQSGASHKNEG